MEKKRFKLSSMMLLQYMMYAVWWVPLAAYLTNIEVGSIQKSLILSSMALAALHRRLSVCLPTVFLQPKKYFSALI